jgi:hypothetical protein
MIIKVRECFVRVSICNQLKLLNDIMKKNMNAMKIPFVIVKNIPKGSV